MNKHYIIPIFVPHLGCPHDCVFCNQKRITGVTKEPTAEQVVVTINKYLATIGQVKHKGEVEVAFYGGSFTAIPVYKQNELLQPVVEFIKKGLIDNIRISTRPDCIDAPALVRLKEYGVTIIELGVQSLDSEVLLRAGRGHQAADVYQAVELIKAEGGIKLGLQMMIGLPGDTLAKARKTALEIIGLKPNFVRIYPTLVIKDTPLAELYERGAFTPLSLVEAVEMTKQVYLLFRENEIPVIRIGLQPSEEISEKGDVLAGPFHPAFRELVESSIALDKMMELLVIHKFNVKDAVTFEVAPKDISITRGQKNSNIKFLREKFALNQIAVLPNEKLPRREIILVK